MVPPGIMSYKGVHLLLHAGCKCDKAEGLQCMGSIMRLRGLENLFKGAQKKEKLWVGLNILRTSINKLYSEYAAKDCNVFEERAHKWMTRAKRLLEASCGSGILNQWEEARECYTNAHDEFMKAGKPLLAGEASCLASDCGAKLGSDVECASDLLAASRCYYESSPLDAVACLQRVIKIHSRNERYCKVAKYEKEVAEIHERLWEKTDCQTDLENSLLHYQEAYNYYAMKGTRYLTERNACLCKVSSFNALLGKYSEAIATFETLNATLTGDKIKADGLFRAMLCHLVDIRTDNRLQGIEKSNFAFDQYSDREPHFQSGKEYNLIRDISTAVNRQDIFGFETAVAEYRTCREPEYWRDYMLEKVEKNLIEVLDSVDKLTFNN